MPIDSWLPIDHRLPDGTSVVGVRHADGEWQIVEIAGGGRALIAKAELAARWTDAGLLEKESLASFAFGGQVLCCLVSAPSSILAPVNDCRSPARQNEALAFALALKATRAVDTTSPLQDAIYVESVSRLLPIYSDRPRIEDDMVLGLWLTGGAHISTRSFRQLSKMLTWMVPLQLEGVLDAAGLPVAGHNFQEIVPDVGGIRGDAHFSLPGRPEIEAFFDEHVVDIVRNAERYKALGINFPSAIVLHGPTGSGKTFAVSKMVEFLGWPSFHVDASSVGSPFIHETSRKIAEVFEKAMANRPSVLVIDEAEAFLADRERGAGSSHHRIEEVAEFLRRIPEATQNQVLVIAMTNRIDMIDQAILRRGRFDHVIKVDYATHDEIQALLESMLSDLPVDGCIDCAQFAKELCGRPLSDVAFVVREAARLAGRAGHSRLNVGFVVAALKVAPSRVQYDASKTGFGREGT